MYVTLYYVIKVRVLKYLSNSCKTKHKQTEQNTSKILTIYRA